MRATRKLYENEHLSTRLRSTVGLKPEGKLIAVTKTLDLLLGCHNKD